MCNQTIDLANKTIAMGRNPVTGCDPVSNVTIRSVATTTQNGRTVHEVTLSARGTDGQPHVYGPYVWADESLMWAACPSTLPSDATPEPGPTPLTRSSAPQVGAAGTLYLSRYNVLEVSADAAAGRPKIAYDGAMATPKFPDKLLLSPEIEPLKVNLTRLTLVGTELETGTFSTKTIDLLDRAHVPPQTLALGDGAIKVLLTEAGRQAYGLPQRPPGTPLTIVPVRLLMAGREIESDAENGNAAEFDLINYYKPVTERESPPEHTIVLAAGTNVTGLSLTEAGLKRFNTIPALERITLSRLRLGSRQATG
ncbi:MAG TPA: hypothetical protein VFS43_00780 [Polyangiaceae bacterium]|nr:hypothetical protein [Polyangiaceae bacterium]